MLKAPLVKKILLSLGLVLLTGAAVFAALWQSIPLDLQRLDSPSASPALFDCEGKLFHLRLSSESEWRLPIPLAEMGPWLPRIAVGVEDGRFYSHRGIDLMAIARATAQNAAACRVVSGASTITSQLIRLAVSERETEEGSSSLVRRPRTLATKVREFILALKLERVLSKEQILERYLNLAPFGGNIRGVQAASLIYFGKPAFKLSPSEACLMIGMLKGPTLYRPDTRPEAARERRDAIIRLMERKGVFTRETAERALLEELPRGRTAPPLRAWHFAEMVLGDRPERTGSITTSLRLDFQTRLESILRQAARELPQDITLAAGVVENSTARLVAWVGNARFGGRGTGAWVDCGLGLRSPGSTLKPFAYLSAIDQGLLTPASLLADSAMAFSGRAPRNFDLHYRGAVSVRTALSESLNASAVRVLRMAGPNRVLHLMREAGLRHLSQSAAYYGDSLILGGCDVTLMEELEAFTALASLGRHRPLSLLKDDAQVPETRIASEAACWIVCDILNHRGPLSTLPRGTLGVRWQAALKTGTSYGLRDAWTAAWTPDFTTVVWVGRPTGESWPGLVGLRAAAPVAMRILRAISPNSGWYDKPDALALRRVCSLSGQPPTAACPSTQLDWFIESVTRTVPCPLHTIKAGQTALLLPPELSAPDTPLSRIKRSSELKIVSPISGATYFTAPFDRERRIPMKAEGGVERVHWYLDGQYMGSSNPRETFFHGVPDGRHVIGAADEAGRSSVTEVSVVTPGKRQNAPAPRLN